MIDTNKGLIAWFARNNVAANLLMIIIIVGGLLTANSIRKQFFPAVEDNWLQFSAVYPGAAPQEVEEGITIKIEDALESVQGLKRIITYSNRGSSNGWFEIDETYNPQVVLDEVKSAIDTISTFPAAMEPPQVVRNKYEQEVMYISLYGDLSPKQLKDLGQTIHDEILQLPLVNISDFFSGLRYEISIEVSKDKLREYGLRFSDVSNAVRNYSQNMSAGQIRTQNGYINLRVENQAYVGFEYEKIPLITLADGTNIKLGDIANINDGFEEGIQYSKFNGKNAVTFSIKASSDQSITDVAKVVKRYLNDKQAVLPQGVKIEPWVDMTYYLNGRLDLMLDSMKTGAVLVFLMLALFLRVRLAFWVMVGLPVCFLGTLLLMPLSMIDVTINVISLFAFILVLGIVVDDAIVMGESAHTECEEQGQSIDSVIRGVKKVAMPATFGVLTTIAAFLPFTQGTGPGSAFGQAIGFVVILCLLFSLVESKLILPAHLARMKPPKVVKPGSKNPLDWLRLGIGFLQKRIDNGLQHIISNIYRPFLTIAVKYRYTVIMSFVGFLIVCAGLYGGGFVRFIGQPKIPSDFPRISLEMKVDASEKATLAGAMAVKDTLIRIDNEIEKKYGQKMLTDIQVRLQGRTRAQISTKLVDPELRPMDTFAIADMWRNAFPIIPGMKTLTVQDSLLGGGRDDGDISFRLQGKDESQLIEAGKELKAKLQSLKGVGDVNDSRQSSTKEIQFELKPQAYALGLTLRDVALQANYSFYGLEAQRIIRDGEELKVMIRYPEHERNSIAQVSDLLIQTKSGDEVPLSDVATIQLVDGVNSIRRENGNRTVNVWASIDADQVEPFEVAKELRENYLPDLLKKYPRVKSELAGNIQEQLDSTSTQLRDFIISLLVIYSLLAIPLKSYAQPMIIMSVIPFGIIGSVLGHMILGIDLSGLSILGIIAAAGVVVNDSLVMVDYINNARKQGIVMKTAVVNAGCRRFRAILLTSLTTFIGVTPIILETSMQAKMVIPMAVSLGFGVLFATIVTLLLIPCVYLFIEDTKRFFRNLFTWTNPTNT
ncbi:efflux RND transporter permease subunit [Parashewanella spongiae]|uniref:Efflux RND transporter permease subunit n=1 Tax=Parashewanella spongiae TaxID=342950 RepID=A0A3A6U3J1_9GAMM|nr:efflux RND transporter permease subunit [Parashewanella spongiae]MCL1078207.1 efflux RND transporter permease subunit [Parashewanella spongiae]RJY16402.1 efflux RND transporter permease subunit [Parashewanella spongiae]